MMKYLDEFRDPKMAIQLVEQIRAVATQRWVVMDVCGGQTHSLLRHGIEADLVDKIEFVHGPGCPVCVTPVEAIDFVQTLAMRDDVIVTSFGDMLRVPGSRDSLLGARSQGANIRAVYTPLDAVKLAQQTPDRQIIFFAVGFETTAPSTALAVLQADRLGLNNFSLCVAHVCVLPAMESLMQDPATRIQGFLGAGHVCTITGLEAYESFVERYQIPVVVTGFEPIDLLHGILEVVKQLESRSPRLMNGYSRSVRSSGNEAALKTMNEVYMPVDSLWRGMGVIEGGGLVLRDRYRSFDARARFAVSKSLPIVEESRCASADVLSGRIKPSDCGEFGIACRPEHPLGAPMVSSEGACAAYFRYQLLENAP